MNTKQRKAMFAKNNHTDKFGNPESTRYDIVRFFSPSVDRPNRVIRKNVDGNTAYNHVNDPKTRKDGKYFDGFRKRE